jgi:ankyrin repeat protein
MSGYRIKLIELVAMGQIDEVEKLLKQGHCNVDESDDFQRNAMFMAVSRNDYNMVALLIDYRAKLDTRYKGLFGIHTTFICKKKGYVNIVNLIEKKSSV